MIGNNFVVIPLTSVVGGCAICILYHGITNTILASKKDFLPSTCKLVQWVHDDSYEHQRK
jgi:hypothetical protein